VSNPSKRATALADLAARLAWITVAHGYNSDAGEHIFLGEQPAFGPDDPPAAIAIVVGDDSPTQLGPTIRSTVPVEVQAYVPADLDAPLLALEALIADIKVAVEIEGNDQNATLGGSASVDRSLEGTLPKGLDRGATRSIPRAEGSTVVGVSVEYRLTFEERWGKPGAEVES
jgi:hypothetical protein